MWTEESMAKRILNYVPWDENVYFKMAGFDPSDVERNQYGSGKQS